MVSNVVRIYSTHMHNSATEVNVKGESTIWTIAITIAWIIASLSYGVNGNHNCNRKKVDADSDCELSPFFNTDVRIIIIEIVQLIEGVTDLKVETIKKDIIQEGIPVKY